MILSYNENGERLPCTDSIDQCPHCGCDWYQTKKDKFGRDAPPMFETLTQPTDYEETRLVQLNWGVVCHGCDNHWVQVNLCRGGGFDGD